MAVRFSFGVGEATTTALSYAADHAGATLILGHGAGAPQTHPWMVKAATAISARGIDVVTFNFLYTETRRRAPDRNDVLEATWMAAIDAVRSRSPGKRLFLGGKSMGGRIATQVAAKLTAGEVDGTSPAPPERGRNLKGLVLLGYPLHPPGKPAQLRTAHLPRVSAPMLFVQGSRDAFGTPEELRPVLAGLAKGTRLVVVDGGDHSFARPKSSGQTLDDTLAHVAGEVAQFIGS
jgi:predicted alpha/beta-hydrolase family hydrolase